MRRQRLVAILIPFVTLTVAAVWIGCGEDDPANIPPAGQDGGDSSSSTTDGSSGTDANVPTDSGTDATITDAGTDATDGGGDGGKDAALNSNPGKVSCGGSPCDAGDGFCCVAYGDAGGEAGSSVQACVPDTQTCGVGTEKFDCDQRLDCGDGGVGSQICCYDVGDPLDRALHGSECKATCSVTNDVPLCRTNAECGVGSTCGFYNCRGQRVGICSPFPADLADLCKPL